MRHSSCRAWRFFRQRLVVLMPEVSHGLKASGRVTSAQWAGMPGGGGHDKAGESADFRRPTTGWSA